MLIRMSGHGLASKAEKTAMVVYCAKGNPEPPDQRDPSMAAHTR